jgi:signal transduction histidine kinase
VDRSDRIITELVGYARLTEGRVEKLKVTEELDQAVARVFPPAVQYDIRIHRDYADVLPPLLMQRSHLSEILVNVLQNAREAMNGRGNIRLSAQLGQDYSVVVAITDDGPGIARRDLERIFEASFTTKEKGTGLGLAIARHNSEFYGGAITAESELGKGTTFNLTFPGRTVIKLRK